LNILKHERKISLLTHNQVVSDSIPAGAKHAQPNGCLQHFFFFFSM